jgi:hypothetical protein
MQARPLQRRALEEPPEEQLLPAREGERLGREHASRREDEGAPGAARGAGGGDIRPEPEPVIVDDVGRGRGGGQGAIEAPGEAELPKKRRARGLPARTNLAIAVESAFGGRRPGCGDRQQRHRRAPLRL